MAALVKAAFSSAALARASSSSAALLAALSTLASSRDRAALSSRARAALSSRAALFTRAALSGGTVLLAPGKECG